MECDILIVGGGLSGLSLATHLLAANQDVQLVEARHRLGGRVLSQTVDDTAFDLGPAWFWPGQPRIASLVQSLNLSVFDQHFRGDQCFEDETGQVQRGVGMASMQGSYRLDGGFEALIDALSAKIPKDRLHLGQDVGSLTRRAGKITATTRSGQEINAHRVVLALPPRVASRISFSPDLPQVTHRTMASIPTWMAGQAKALAIYDRAFWRDAGLSGDAMSRRGPMVEIHDASPVQGGPYALFGFIGVPPEMRKQEEALRNAVLAQLVRIFGPDAATPKALLIQDWAHDPLTATPLDHAPLMAHPSYGMPDALSQLWGGQLLFAGTELASTFGGYIEGALEAADHAKSMLEQDLAVGQVR